MSVEFDGNTHHPLLVFANLPEEDEVEEATAADRRRGMVGASGPNPPFSPPPPAAGGKRITFAAGLHDIGVGFALPKNSVVYLAPGAWVRGTFTTHGKKANNITIHGRGVLDGGLIAHPVKCTDTLALINLCGDGITVSGITAINAPTYLLEVNAFWQPHCQGTKTVVENVKLLAWHYTTDGIMVGRDSVVRNNFVKCNDDALKLFMGSTLWELNTIWQGDNGQSFMLSWITETDETNFTIRDSTVIHVEHTKDYGDQARPSVIGAVHGGVGRIGEYHFRNITVEGDVFRPIGITVEANTWGKESDGSISGVDLSGVNFAGASKVASLIHGTAKQHRPGMDKEGVAENARQTIVSKAFAGKPRMPIGDGDSSGGGGAAAGTVANVAFYKLEEGGKVVLNPSASVFKVDPSTTSNVTFSP
eukprot:gene15703-4375_t